MVAYTGIQTRAENSKTKTAISQLVRVLKVYKTTNGHYPQVTQVSCVGELGASCSFGSKRTVTTELHDMIKTVSASVPQPSTNTAKSSYGAYYTYLRKADVPSLSSDIGYVFYALYGANETCESFGGSYTSTPFSRNSAFLHAWHNSLCFLPARELIVNYFL